MEGRVVYVDRQNGYGRIETQNKDVPRLTFYLTSISFDVMNDDTVSFTIETSSKGIRYAKYVKLMSRNKSKFNTEDKQKWCTEGEELEKAFVERIVPYLNVKLEINPDKCDNPCVIDLIDLTNGKYADLKSQNTPFFTAGRFYYGENKEHKYEPTYTVTFNKKDYENYRNNYPGCDIYWCINWTQLNYDTNYVAPLEGVWRAKFIDMANKIEKGEVYLHEYLHRKNDDINAKDSYLFDLRDITVFERLL